MKKIACVGYHATGAGVIDDFFREFDNVSQGKYETESRFLQDPDGISDLEFHLVGCPNRLTTAIAIERFLRFAKENERSYKKIFGEDWYKICLNYIDSICKFQYEGYNYRALCVKYPMAQYKILFFQIINKLKPKKFRHPGWYNYYNHSQVYHTSITEETFLKETRKFVDVLCENIPHNDKTEYVLIDQMIGGNYPEHYLRYVNDIKVIVVDRDPRDLYIHMRVHNDQKLPHDPVHFCEVYKDIRKQKGNIDAQKVMYTTFEDMIYNYDEMTKKVMGFVGIDNNHHISPRKFFDPTKSIKGTKQWKKYPEFSGQIRIIEKRLPDYLHKY